MRNVYRFLLGLHPARFRERFGEEMLIGFDASSGLAARAFLVGDGFRSALRQWSTRLATPAAGRRKWLWTTAKGFVSAAFFVLVVTNHVAQATVVPTPSMAPAIVPGDHMIVDKIGYPASIPSVVRPYLPQREIHRGDIVVFRWPVDPGVSFVKRVIGLPGDRVEIRSTDVYVNDVKIVETYKQVRDPRISTFDVRDNYGPVTVPDKQYFVLGDNRDNSMDSRYWGFVPRNDIEGEPLLVYWSYDASIAPPPGGQRDSWAHKARTLLSIATDWLWKTRWSRTGAVLK